MTTQTSLPQPESFTFADLIEKYRPSYGASWVEREAEQAVQNVRRACEAKDYAYLVHLRYPKNGFSREVFTRITGIALHTTQRESQRILEEFVGQEAVAAYQRQQEDIGHQREIQRLQHRVSERRVRTERYGTLTVDALIHLLIDDGYTNLIEQKRGVAPEWFLCNDEGSGYTFRRRIEHDYIEHRLEQRKRAAASCDDGKEQQQDA